MTNRKFLALGLMALLLMPFVLTATTVLLSVWLGYWGLEWLAHSGFEILGWIWALLIASLAVVSIGYFFSLGGWLASYFWHRAELPTSSHRNWLRSGSFLLLFLLCSFGLITSDSDGIMIAFSFGIFICLLQFSLAWIGFQEHQKHPVSPCAWLHYFLGQTSYKPGEGREETT